MALAFISKALEVVNAILLSIRGNLGERLSW